MKTIKKEEIEKDIKYYKLLMDRELIQKLKSPYLAKLSQAFQTKENFCLVMEFLENGSLEDFFTVHENLETNDIKFYASEIVKLIEFLHSNGIAHGNLTPEKIFLGLNRHLKIKDFGKALIFNPKKLNSELLSKIEEIKELEANWDGYRFGSSDFDLQYKSPEYIQNYSLSPYSDLWAFGCILYRMFIGRSPFYDISAQQMQQKILNVEFQIPGNVPEHAQQLIRQLLVFNSQDRLGANDFEQLKQHQFFNSIDWQNLHQLRPPFMLTDNFQFTSSIIVKPAPVIETIETVIQPQEVQIIAEQLIESKIVEEIQVEVMQPPPEQQITEEKEEVPSPVNYKLDQFVICFKIVTESQIMKEHGEQQILKSIVLKKCGWVFYQPRLMILYDSGKLRYFHPSKNHLKGEILLGEQNQIQLFFGKDEIVKVEKTKKDSWQIVTAQRIYSFQDFEKSIKANEWVTKIHQMIAQME